MNKKVVYLALISVIILGMGINTSHQLSLWGFETVSGGDEFAHFARAQNIARGYVDVYHEYDNPHFYDLYPSGFNVLSAEFIILSGFQSHYYTSFIFKIIYSLMVGIIVFLIGAKINWKVGVFSSFFLMTYFRIYTWKKTFYINVSSPQNTLTSVFISTTLILFTILLYMMFLKTRDREVEYGVLIVIAGTVHGISHISTYIGFILNFIGFSAIIMFLIMFRYRAYLSKMVNIILYTLLSIPFVFFIYYFPMFPDILSSAYYPDKFFPPFIPSAAIPYLPEISAMMLLTIVSVLVIYNKYVAVREITYIKTDRKLFGFMIAAYLAMYGLVLFLVSKNPYRYPGSGELILMGIFPTYIPHSIPGLVSTLSLIVGFSMYLLTLFAFLWAYKSKFVNFNFILLLYFSFYLVWFFSAIVIKYYPSRIMYFQFILPFVYAAGLVSLLTPSKKRSSSGILKFLKSPFIKKSIAVAIVAMFLSMSVVSQITKEPELRPELNIERISIGKTRPPRDVSSFMYEVGYLTEPGDYVLATPETLEVVCTMEGTRSPTNHWSQTYADHSNWGITINAIRGTDIDTFFEKYNATYLVVGYGDIHGFSDTFGNKYHDPDIYSQDPNLVLIYEDQYGERIYAWVGP